MTIAAKMADFTLKTSYDDIPPNVKELAKTALVDYVGVTYIGANMDESDIIKRYIERKPQNNESKAIGINGYYSMEDAAMMNGFFSHLLDYDDAGLVGHPSAVLMSTCFAAGETMAITGKELMTAYIIGYEITLKLADALMPMLTSNGWHGTPVFGNIGATIVAGRIFKLSKEQLTNAIGIATTMASGLMENFGTVAKPFHAGMAAANGIRASRLAQAGLTSSPTSIEGECGYAKLFAHTKLEEEDLEFGGSWNLFLQDLLLKKYPCCSAAHTALDGIEEICREQKLHYKDVKQVVVGVPKFTLKNLIHPEPKNSIEARFSMNYALATLLVTGKFDVDSFSGKVLNNKEIRKMMKKIEMKEGEDFKGTEYIDNEPAVIDLYTYNQDYYHKRIDFSKGTTVNPLSEEELHEKFFACLGGKNNTSIGILEGLKNIEQIPDIRFFMGTVM